MPNSFFSIIGAEIAERMGFILHKPLHVSVDWDQRHISKVKQGIVFYKKPKRNDTIEHKSIALNRFLCTSHYR